MFNAMFNIPAWRRIDKGWRDMEVLSEFIGYSWSRVEARGGVYVSFTAETRVRFP
jgi:hypothetical protein